MTERELSYPSHIPAGICTPSLSQLEHYEEDVVLGPMTMETA